MGFVKERLSNEVYFTNMLPGDYVVKVKTSCLDQNIPFTFTPHKVLTQDVHVEAKSQCGGNGTIIAKTNYNGASATVFQLVNTSGDLLQENSTGLFPNLPAGEYKARLKVNERCQGVYYIDAIEGVVSILDGNSAPVITKKVGIICEDGVNPTGTGSVYLTIAGSSPKLEYKATTATDWTTHKEAASEQEVINNLLPGVTYDLKVTSCGKTSQTQVTLGELTVVKVSNTAQPCVGNPYTLSMPDYPGATYEWKNSAGAVVSTNRNYQIGNYNKSYDGTYTAKVMFGQCLVRVSTVTVYGELCQQPIAEFVVSGNVYHDNNNDGTVNGTKIEKAGTSNLYVSIIKNDKIVTTVKVGADGTYSIPGIPAGNYQLVISGQQLGSLTAALPNGWVTNGESLDNTNDGKMNITVSNTDVSGADFGIQQAPISYDVTINFDKVPVVGVAESLASEPFRGSDPDGTPSTESNWANKPVIINTTPTNGFILKYDGTVVTEGQKIDNYDPALLTIEAGPTTPSGTKSTAFTYSVIDDLGAVSTTPATYFVNFEKGLPVVVSSFTLSQNNGCKVSVKWTVALESNIEKYVIERSVDGQSFISLGNVDPKGSSSSYEFEDESSVEGTNYYRLKILEKGGIIKYHTTSSIVSSGSCASSVSLYPTVTNGAITLTGASATSVNVVSAVGQTVFTKTIVSNNERIDVSKLANGVYFITGKKAGAQFTLKFIKK